MFYIDCTAEIKYIFADTCVYSYPHQSKGIRGTYSLQYILNILALENMEYIDEQGITLSVYVLVEQSVVCSQQPKANTHSIPLEAEIAMPYF